MIFDGFDWDEGNAGKCLKHGVSAAEIENLFRGECHVAPDMRHSGNETRYLAIGRAGIRHVFVAFTWRRRNNRLLIRPISARYMHSKEIEAYGEEAAS